MILTGAHYIYIIFILIILAVMIMKKDTIVPCMLGIFALAFFYTNNVVASVGAIFNSLIIALIELGPIILIISIMVSLSKTLEDNSSIEYMVKPFSKIIKNETSAFFIIGFMMLLLSWFFWPSPATALIGAIFLPIAKKAKLPAIGVAMALNLFGHGVALSTDFIIQGAPSITAGAAGVDVSSIMTDGILLFLTMSTVTITTAFYMLKRDIKTDKISIPTDDEKSEAKNFSIKAKISTFLVIIAFSLDIVCMAIFNLKGGDATALIGGTAMVLIFIICLINFGKNGIDKICQNLTHGFTFGIKIFATIIPIAAFFYMGEVSPITSLLGAVLPQSSQGLLSDIGLFISQNVTLNRPIAAVIETFVGVITGLDGSGFSGMALAGSLAGVLGTATNTNIGVLAALGQIGAIWTGGGCLVPWSLIPAAAICGVSPMELAKRNFIPIIVGLIITTIVAIIII